MKYFIKKPDRRDNMCFIKVNRFKIRRSYIVFEGRGEKEFAAN
ncbi:MAG TPA: hypothetical protein VJL78_03370 [Candidatus Nitrosocosmicus sp.]|nr:hypothetical protein [Candidatus Nitrosocosmicus sp.]